MKTPLQQIQASDLVLSSDELSSDLMTESTISEARAILKSRSFNLMLRLAKLKVMTRLNSSKSAERIEVLAAANAFHNLDQAMIDVCSQEVETKKKKTTEDQL